MLKYVIDSRDPVTKLSPESYGLKPTHGLPTARMASSRGHRYRHGPAFFLKFAQIVEDDPMRAELLKAGIEDLQAIQKYMLIPGTATARTHVHLDGRPYEDATVAGFHETLLWAYALAYKETGDPAIWEAIRGIVQGYGMGDIGAAPGQGVALKYERGDWNLEGEFVAFLVHTFVELYEKTGGEEYLRYAGHLSDVLVDQLFVDGLFVKRPGAMYARTACLIPLALLHVEAATHGQSLDSSSVFPRHLCYRGNRKFDRKPNDIFHDYAIYDRLMEATQAP
jgi:hypothetical protein